jgi:hypothetical protein
VSRGFDELSSKDYAHPQDTGVLGADIAQLTVVVLEYVRRQDIFAIREASPDGRTFTIIKRIE